MTHLNLYCRCGTRLKLPADSVGKSAPCPSCQGVIRLVGASPAQDAEIPHCLVIRKGPKRVGEQIFLVGELDIMVGKLPGTNILLSGAAVSRTHCRLTSIPSGWQIHDQASTNGVFVNGRKISVHPLSNNDRVGIGEYEFVYVHKTPVQRVVTSFAIPPAGDED